MTERFLFLVLLAAMACQKPHSVKSVAIFNSDSLLDSQIKMLTRYRMEKVLKVDGEEFSATSASSVNWGNELAIFRLLDQINRPIYRNSYLTDTAPDAQSNLTVTTYTAQSDIPLRQFRVFYLRDRANIKRLEADFETHSIYEHAEKKIRLDFSLLGSHRQLEGYQISGSQQYFWGNSVNFSVQARIW